MLAFVGLDQRDQDVELFAFRCTWLRHHQRFDFFQCRTVVGVSADRFDVHLPLPLALYRLDIDLVVLGMGANKADVDYAIGIVDPDH